MCYHCSLAACSVPGTPCWKTGIQNQVMGSVKVFLTASHAKPAWDCIPCMSKMLLNCPPQLGSSYLLLSGMSHHCTLMPRQLQRPMSGTSQASPEWAPGMSHTKAPAVHVNCVIPKWVR